MCVECKFGPATGLKLYWNCFRYLLDKVTGLDALQYNNLCRFMALSEDFRDAMTAEAEQVLREHGEPFKNSWRYGLFVSRRLDHYENVR